MPRATTGADSRNALDRAIGSRELLPSGEVQAMLDGPGLTGLRRRLRRTRQRLRAGAARVITVALDGSEPRLAGRFRSECPVCDWRGLAFRPFVGPGYVNFGEVCPRCRSSSRHRLFALAWKRWDRLPRDGVCLYVAPEPCLAPLIADGRHVITTDLVRTDVDVSADLERTPLRAGSVDLLVCSDVLEHVHDDHAALTEVHRVLAPGGVALVHVPIMVDRTVDYGRAIEIDYGHVRAYGPDVLDRFRRAGFDVDVFGSDSEGPDTFRRAGLNADAVFALTTADSG